MFGEVLGREESYIDVEVDGVDSDGNVFLVDKKEKDTWTISMEELRDLHEDLLAVGESEIPFPKHQIWTDLENLGETRVEADFNHFVDDHLKRSQKNLFKAIIEAGR